MKRIFQLRLQGGHLQLGCGALCIPYSIAFGGKFAVVNEQSAELRRDTTAAMFTGTPLSARPEIRRSTSLLSGMLTIDDGRSARLASLLPSPLYPSTPAGASPHANGGAASRLDIPGEAFLSLK